MLGNRTPARTNEQWIEQYSSSHQNPINRFCHTLGIPMIAVSLPLGIGGFWMRSLWYAAAVLFIGGWIFQFVGHYFEGKPPEFFSDYRFLFVGLRWWFAKMRGKA